ncbi:MAG TPA: YaiI/YqxD family protein [Azonexus sp.]
MHIWVDADACPGVIKEILYRAAERKHIATTLVANQMLRTPPSRFIRAIQVPRGFDVADAHIVGQVAAGDLVVTADIPLAALVIERGAHALNPRGELYTAATIRERLAMRNFMEELRSAGVDTGGPAAFGQAERQAFANQLDRFLAHLPAPTEDPS